jgi:aryl-alcohol dehydrogenase-like predicted oxidoreductase
MSALSALETTAIPGTDLNPSRIGLGTWEIGDWLSDDASEAGLIRTIQAALDRGVTLIDTAPVYGLGRSEEIVGKALAQCGLRNRVLIASKGRLDRMGDRPFRNAGTARIAGDIEDSLRRLRTDVIDLYQVHWADPTTPVEETAEAMAALLRAGKIRSIGVSNCTPEQMDAFRTVAPLHTTQASLNIFERESEIDVLPYCGTHAIVTLVHGAVCGGMLSGRMTIATRFNSDNPRRRDPKFRAPRLHQYLNAVGRVSAPSTGSALRGHGLENRSRRNGGDRPDPCGLHRGSGWTGFHDGAPDRHVPSRRSIANSHADLSGSE